MRGRLGTRAPKAENQADPPTSLSRRQSGRRRGQPDPEQRWGLAGRLGPMRPTGPPSKRKDRRWEGEKTQKTQGDVRFGGAVTWLFVPAFSASSYVSGGG